ncbi:MAG: glycoside hydrolase family 9 protein [Lacipirellulaceae bacterium]
MRLLLVLLVSYSAVAAEQSTDYAAWPVSPRVVVDQFGYLPDDAKVAVLSDPVKGKNAAAEYAPPAKLLLLRLPHDVVGRYAAKPWNGGAVESSSGDRGWWVDFSDVHDEGEYLLIDESRRVTSGPFRIARDVYDPVLRAACRMFFYQRSGLAKEEPYAEAPWTDAAAMLGPGQDGEARDCTRRDDPSTARDLRGGWFDAGDYNKYVTFSVGPVHDLLTAYTDNPRVFTDDFGIPESGNGVPDLIDEVRVNVAWVRRMQTEEGSVCLKVGEVDHDSPSPPSSDTRPRFYVGPCSSSTIAHSGMLAHAAAVWRLFPSLKDEADEMLAEARRSWEHYHAHDRQTDCDDGTVKAGNADEPLEGQDSLALTAAVWLWITTGDESYHAYVRAHYEGLDCMKQRGANWGFGRPEAADALIAYARRNGADPAVRDAVLAARREGAAADWTMLRWSDTKSLYRAPVESYLLHWGSMRPRSEVGASNAELVRLTKNAAQAVEHRRLATGHLHYVHGVNPMSLCYLTSMEREGAERSVGEMFHCWFNEGTPLDRRPAPGYLVGGPNKDYAGDALWIKRQPPEKAFHQFNTGWPAASWEITEPSNTYQGAYVKLLARVMPR